MHRERLLGTQFTNQVLEQFSFLESFGFQCAETKVSFVRYVSPVAGVELRYDDQRSYEIELWLCPSSSTDAYSMSELLSLLRQEGHGSYATHDLQGVDEGVSLMAKQLKEFFSTACLNDSLFSKLKLQRQENSAKYAFEIQIQQARRRASAAWRKKDYSVVVNTLEPFRAALTASEVGRLEYAEMKLKHS